MKDKLYKVSYVFIISWITQDVCRQPYFESLTYSIFMSIGAAIYLGIHQDISGKIKESFAR